MEKMKDVFSKPNLISSILNERVLNIPNTITFARFTLLPFFVITMLKTDLNSSLIIFTIIAITDKLDGISSRMMKQVTEFGRSFDSFIDWSVFLVAFFLLVTLGYIETFWAPLLAFPATVIFLSKLMFLKKQKEIPITPLAKISGGMAYTTVISILINFVYAKQILIAMFIVVYLSMIRYIILTAKLHRFVKT